MRIRREIDLRKRQAQHENVGHQEHHGRSPACFVPRRIEMLPRCLHHSVQQVVPDKLRIPLSQGISFLHRHLGPLYCHGPKRSIGYIEDVASMFDMRQVVCEAA